MSRFRSQPLFEGTALASIVLGLLLASPESVAAAERATLEALPVFQPPANRSESGWGVTDDGVVVGAVAGPAGTLAARWPASGFANELGSLPGASTSIANAVSADGSIVVGASFGASGGAFRWTAATGMTELPGLSEESGSQAKAISANGQFIAGLSPDAGGLSRGVRWNAALDPVDIGDLGGIPAAAAHGISADGRVIVGYSYPTPNLYRAVRWKSGTLTNLGALSEIGGDSYAAAASADGAIVVGYQIDSPLARAWRWTPATGIKALRRIDTSSQWSAAADISDDGRIIVGDEGTETEAEACIWIDGEPFDLKRLLASKYDVDVQGWTLRRANGVSPSGRFITGLGILQGKNRAFRVYLPNEKPIANAGKDVVVNARNDDGASVKLDGRDSSDPEGQRLTYRWTAKGVRFNSPSAAQPSATFPVGTTTVTLRVTDPDRASDTDTVRVTVRPKNSRARPQGEAANLAFAESAELMRVRTGHPEASLAEIEGALLADQANAIGEALGDLIVWNEVEPVGEATRRYAELRRVQYEHGLAAAAKLAQASIETGDPATTEAARATDIAVRWAFADLADR